MLGCLVLCCAAPVMNWIYWLEMEGMQLKKDSFISKSTCYTTLYSTLNLSYSLVTHARAAAYTKNNIMSAFKGTGIWPLNPGKVFLGQSQNIGRLESLPATPTRLLNATPMQVRTVSWLTCSALHLVTRQSPSSHKLKALVAQLGRSAQGALADQELGDDMLRTLRSGANDTNLVAATERSHLGKARVYTAEDVVQLREESLRLKETKWPTPKCTKKRLQQR